MHRYNFNGTENQCLKYNTNLSVQCTAHGNEQMKICLGLKIIVLKRNCPKYIQFSSGPKQLYQEMKHNIKGACCKACCLLELFRICDCLYI